MTYAVIGYLHNIYRWEYHGKPARGVPVTYSPGPPLKPARNGKMDENSELETGAKAAPDAVKNTDTVTKTTGLSIANKLLGIVLMLIAMLVTVAAIGGYQMNRIGDELIEIAEHDVPMTEAVTQITIHQLEQAIALERAFRFGEEMRTDAYAEQKFEEADREFEKYAELADAEFKATEEFIAEAVKTGKSVV